MKHSICYVISLLLLMTACSYAEPDKTSQKNQDLVEKKRNTITAEIEKLPDHSWAGRYYFGDGLGTNVTLTLAPESGFTVTWYGCLGLYDLNYGEVVWDKDRLKFSFALANGKGGIGSYAAEYFPVRWGKRVYLVPSNEMIGFCNAINSRSEPRKGPHGFFFLRDDDWKTEVGGKPELPEKLLPYLLDEPVDAKIVSIAETKEIKKIKDTTVIVNKGKKDGLLPGMELHVTSPDMIFEEVRLTKVDEMQSEGVFRTFPHRNTLPQAGWKLSTCPRWRRSAKENTATLDD